jgi:hypothetical protein
MLMLLSRELKIGKVILLLLLSVVILAAFSLTIFIGFRLTQNVSNIVVIAPSSLSGSEVVIDGKRKGTLISEDDFSCILQTRVPWQYQHDITVLTKFDSNCISLRNTRNVEFYLILGDDGRLVDETDVYWNRVCNESRDGVSNTVTNGAE